MEAKAATDDTWNVVELHSQEETEINRYRLTFDAHPKGKNVQFDIKDRENPLDLYEHPYAYLNTRGHPGKRVGPTGLRAA